MTFWNLCNIDTCFVDLNQILKMTTELYIEIYPDNTFLLLNLSNYLDM